MAKFFALSKREILLVEAVRRMNEAKQAGLYGVLDYLRRGEDYCGVGDNPGFVDGLRVGLLLADDTLIAVQCCKERGDEAGADVAVSKLNRVYQMCLQRGGDAYNDATNKARHARERGAGSFGAPAAKGAC